VYGHPFDIERFADHERTDRHVRARCVEKFERSYEIVHPAEEWLTARGARLSPVHARLLELGASCRDVGGWEVPTWYAANEPLVAEYGERVLPRSAEWEARWWSPIVNAEHLAMRERAGIADLSAHGAWELVGPGACVALQALVVEDVDVAVGGVVETWLLDPAGAIVTALTVLRLGPGRFRLLGLPEREARDRTWLREHLPMDGSLELIDVTGGWAVLRVIGPRADDLVEAALGRSSRPVETMSATPVELGSAPAVGVTRRSPEGRTWEFHIPADRAPAGWDALWAAGREVGAVAVGAGVYRGTARLEAGEPALGTELGSGANLVEAGLASEAIKAAEFIGRAAYLEQRARPPTRRLVTLTLDDPASATGEPRYMLGGEPIIGPDRDLVRDATGRPCQVSSAASGPTIGRHLLMAYLPPEQAVVGATLAVEYFGERYPVSVASVGADPALDRLRAGVVA
jgi:glycine cleavage system aminomethyltransferase T